MTTKLRVTGMSCAGCESNVEDALSAVPGVVSVDVVRETDAVTVEGEADPDDLVAAVEGAGYEAAPA